MEELARYSHEGMTIVLCVLLLSLSGFKTNFPFNLFVQTTMEKIYNVLLFPDGGWMVDHRNVRMCLCIAVNYGVDQFI